MASVVNVMPSAEQAKKSGHARNEIGCGRAECAALKTRYFSTRSRISEPSATTYTTTVCSVSLPSLATSSILSRQPAVFLIYPSLRSLPYLSIVSRSHSRSCLPKPEFPPHPTTTTRWVSISSHRSLLQLPCAPFRQTVGPSSHYSLFSSDSRYSACSFGTYTLSHRKCIRKRRTRTPRRASYWDSSSDKLSEHFKIATQAENSERGGNDNAIQTHMGHQP